MSAAIVASSVLCAIGRGNDQAWASARAGLGRIASSRVMDRNQEPIAMGLVPEEALEPLPPEIDALPLPFRARRMLRLAAPVLRHVGQTVGEAPLRLYLGLPELTQSQAPWIRSFALHLGKFAGLAIDAPNSRIVPSGRAAVLKAIELALETLEREPETPIVVGGVDSFLDLRLLAELEGEQRIHGSLVQDGFVPGEGAAFLVLAHSSVPLPEGPERRVVVQAAATASDVAHRYAAEPARGEGLAQAIEVLRGRAGGVGAVSTTFAGLNGESFDTKLWGVARLRHSDFFAPAMTMEHPADCMGDTGAAAGAILTGLAATALSKGHRAGPALVWAASDREPRGCALLSVA